MAELTLKEKKELAYILYENEVTQKDIAKRLKVSEKSLCKWVKDGGWEDLRTHRTITRKTELKRYYMQIKELNDKIASRPAGERYPSPSESDTLNKLSAAARQLEIKTPVGEIVNTCEELINFIKTNNLSDAKAFIPWIDAFVQSKMKNETAQ